MEDHVKVKITEEDILNLENAINNIVWCKGTKSEHLEIFTIQNIIKQYCEGQKTS